MKDGNGLLRSMGSKDGLMTHPLKQHEGLFTGVDLEAPDLENLSSKSNSREKVKKFNLMEPQVTAEIVVGSK
jgi:hypothetical protein